MAVSTCPPTPEPDPDEVFLNQVAELLERARGLPPAQQRALRQTLELLTGYMRGVCVYLKLLQDDSDSDVRSRIATSESMDNPRSAIRDQKSAIGNHRSELGQVLAWTVIMLPVLLMLAGMVFDGGLLWMQWRRARWAADSAAVAAAQEIDWSAYHATGRLSLGTYAIDSALYYTHHNYPELHVTSVYVDSDDTLHMRGWFEVRPTFLSMIGVQPVRLHVSGHEKPVWGASGAGQ